MTTVGTHTVDDAGALRRDPAIAPLGFGGLGDRRFWRSTTLLLSSFPIGVFWFVFLVSALSTGVALSFTFVGVPLLALAMVFWRHGAQAERWRLRTLVGADVPTPYRLVTEGRWWQRMRARAQDPATWRDLVYLLALFPIGIGGLIVVTVVWGFVGVTLTLPLWGWSLPSTSEVFDLLLLVEPRPVGILVLFAAACCCWSSPR